jgi:polar amino acid transport system substrate-binding protein
MRFTRTLLLISAMLLAVGAAAAACGDDDDDDGGGEPTAAATAAPTSAGDGIDITGIEELADGTLTVGNDGAYAPMEFEDENGDLVGLDVDLINAMAELLGVETEHPIAGFETLLTSLDAGRYDVVMSSMSVNPERSQVVDFIEYFNAGIGIVVVEGNPKGITSFDDLCGATVAVQKGTIQVDYLLGTTEAPGGKDAECTGAGSEGITVLEFDSDPEAVQALIAGQADVEMADFPVTAYSALQNASEIDLVDTQIEPSPYGIAVRKDSTALRDALQAAFDQIVEDGTYAEILEKWELSAGALE